MTLEQRFWSKVNKSAPGGCWEWTGAINAKGYGHFSKDGGARRAHRVAWELANDPIPDGMVIDHRCANRQCVNPEHLRVITNTQNLQHRAVRQENNTSGVRNVTWDKKRAAWYVQAVVNGKHHYGGRFSTLEEADAAAKAIRAELFTHDDHDQWVSEQRRRD